ncbi:MAG: hypothetical protein AAFQ02_12395 [Bacteroidota bacterium]
MGVIEQLLEEVRALSGKVDLLSRTVSNLAQDDQEIVSDEIAAIMRISVSSLRKGYDRFVDEGYPLFKRGPYIRAQKAELREFLKNWREEVA